MGAAAAAFSFALAAFLEGWTTVAGRPTLPAGYLSTAVLLASASGVVAVAATATIHFLRGRVMGLIRELRSEISDGIAQTEGAVGDDIVDRF